MHPIPGGKPRTKIELFASIKYTTLTGHRLPGAPAAVCDAQAALEALYTELFLRAGAAS